MRSFGKSWTGGGGGVCMSELYKRLSVLKKKKSVVAGHEFTGHLSRLLHMCIHFIIRYVYGCPCVHVQTTRHVQTHTTTEISCGHSWEIV